MGCLHLGHKWMAQHRGFTDEFYHDEKLIETWNSVVHKNIHENELEEVIVSNRFKDPEAKQTPTLSKYLNVDADGFRILVPTETKSRKRNPHAVIRGKASKITIRNRFATIM